MKNPLKKRVPRELKGEWHKYVTVFVFLTLIIGFISGMYVANHSMLVSNAEGKTKYNLEDGHFRVENEISDDMRKAIESGEQAFETPDPADPVPVTIYENFYKEVSEVWEGDGDTRGDVRVFKAQDKVNGYCIHKGEAPKSADEIAIDRMHADNAGIKVGDTIKVGGTQFKVCALIAFVNYSTLYKKNTDTMFDAITFDVALVTEEGFDRIDSDIYYNYAWFYKSAPADDKEEKTMSEAFLNVLGTQAIVFGNDAKEFVPGYINHAVTFAPDDFGKDKAMGGVILDILVVVLAFIFAMTISNTITKEASVIGTLRASGYTRGELLVHYMTVPVCVTLAAAIIGNILGYTLFKEVVIAMYYNSYSLPTYETIMNFEALWKTTLIPVALMFVINLVIIARKLTLSPLKFLRHDLKRSKRKKAIRLPKWKFMTRFKTRVLMQNFPNYLTLLLGVCFVMIMMAMAVGMPATLKYYQKHVGEMMFVKEQVVLKSTEDADGNEITTAVKGAERFSMYSLLYRAKKMDESIAVYGIEPDSKYMKIPADLAENEVVISDAFNGKYGFKAGDTITLWEEYENKSYDFKVRDVVPYSGAIAVFMYNDSFNEVFGYDEGSFMGYLSQSPIDDIDEKYILTTIGEKDITKMADQLDHSMGSFMLYFQYLCIILSVVLIYLLTKIIIEKNENAISMTKILGYNNREINSLYILPTLFVMIIEEVIGIFVGYLIMQVVWKSYMARLGGWFEFNMGIKEFVRMFVMIFVAYIIVMLIDTRRIRKVPMDEALKNVE